MLEVFLVKMDKVSETFIIRAINEINQHITIINDELGVLKTDVAILKTQMVELMWLQRLVVGTVLLAVIGAILTLIIRRKNSKSS